MHTVGKALVLVSQWIDKANERKDSEAITWGRLSKCAEESGEVISAYIGVTGQNPRKGVTHTIDDVKRELLDVAITALAAYEHIDNHMGNALPALAGYIHTRAERLGIDIYGQD